jgi:hypothetical protein
MVVHGASTVSLVNTPSVTTKAKPEQKESASAKNDAKPSARAETKKGAPATVAPAAPRAAALAPAVAAPSDSAEKALQAARQETDTSLN